MEKDKKFVMVVMDTDDGKEVSILDTEEYNVQIFCCNCEEEDLFFCKQEVEQVERLLNFQDEWINSLIEKVEKQSIIIEGLKNLLSEKEKETVHKEILQWENDFNLQEVSEEELEEMAKEVKD